MRDGTQILMIMKRIKREECNKASEEYNKEEISLASVFGGGLKLVNFKVAYSVFPSVKPKGSDVH